MKCKSQMKLEKGVQVVSQPPTPLSLTTINLLGRSERRVGDPKSARDASDSQDVGKKDEIHVARRQHRQDGDRLVALQ